MTTHRGYVLLYTVLIASIILAMTLGILSVATKEITFSAQSTQSHFSFFASDAGVECALKYDMQTPSFFDGSNFPTGQATITCANTHVTVVRTVNPDTSETYAFDPFDVDHGCAHVMLSKNMTDTTLGLAGGTVLESRGYNLTCANVTSIQSNPATNDSRLVERLLEYRYRFSQASATTGGTTTGSTGSAPATSGGSGGAL